MRRREWTRRDWRMMERQKKGTEKQKAKRVKMGKK